jgi:hypothetical protein
MRSGVLWVGWVKYVSVGGIIVCLLIEGALGTGGSHLETLDLK